MSAAGVSLAANARDFSVMGFTDVLASLGRLARLERLLRRECLAMRPDALLLVDYPGLNMRLARWAGRRGLRVIYYVSPQLWAWGRGRVRAVARDVDLMIPLFRFEDDFYRRRGVRSFWGGHPLVDAIPREAPGGCGLALLPGSRPSEVRGLLGPMLGCLDLLRASGDGRPATVAVPPWMDGSIYEPARAAGCATGTAEQALSTARAALVCSGTATLETALRGIPFVLMYRTSALDYALARLLVRGLDGICLASIAAGGKVAEELIQNRATARKAFEAVTPLLADGPARETSLAAVRSVRAALGPPGGAARAAARIAEELGE
jgi:lipid-A-disaccharide synthase